MKKRILGMVLCLVMALSLVPMTAYAVDDYGVVVGNTAITSANCDDVFGDGTVSYQHYADRNRGMLKLDGANITTGYAANGRVTGIYSEHGLTIYVCQNGATVDLHNYSTGNPGYGVYVNGDLTFDTGYTRPDPMTVISPAGIQNCGIYATGNICIATRYGTVQATAISANRASYGVRAGSGASISIASGYLHAKTAKGNLVFDGAATNVMPVLVNSDNPYIGKQYVFKGNSGKGLENIKPTQPSAGLMELKVQRMFTDYGFWNYLIDNFDTDNSRHLDEEERNAITSINNYYTRKGIRAIDGLEFLPNLKELQCPGELIESVDLTQCPQLETLNLKNNDLTELDVSKCPNLTELNCDYNALTSLDVSHNTKLINLSCYENPIKSLDVSMCPDLEELNCARMGSNTLETLILGQKNEMKELSCPSLALQSVDVTGCPKLERLECGYISGGVIDLHNNTQLTYLHLDGYQGNKLDLSHNPKMEVLLLAGDTNLTSLDLSKCPEMKELQVNKNGLTSLDLSYNPKLNVLYCYDNPITSINVSKCPALTILDVDNCRLTKLDVSNNPNLKFLYCGNNDLTTLDVGNKPNLVRIHCYGNKLSEVDLTRTQIGSQTPSEAYRAFAGDQKNNELISVYTTPDRVNTLKAYFNINEDDHNHNVLIYGREAPAAGALGDVNNDGKVNQKDVARLRQYLADPVTYPLDAPQNADVNNDTKINQKDVARLRQYLADPKTYPLS